MIETRKLHRLVGLAMLVPLFAWAITGTIFFLKPGYEGAYELLQPKLYPLHAERVNINSNPSWLEFRCFKTILGNHLLVRTRAGWQQLDPATLADRTEPTADELKALLEDAFAANPERYGQVSAIQGTTAITSTNVKIVLNWNQLSLQQTGSDTKRIDWLYRVHYLQWTGIASIDRILGVLGPVLIVVLGVLGLTLQRRPSLRSRQS